MELEVRKYSNSKKNKLTLFYWMIFPNLKEMPKQVTRFAMSLLKWKRPRIILELCGPPDKEKIVGGTILPLKIQMESLNSKKTVDYRTIERRDKTIKAALNAKEYKFHQFLSFF